MNRIFRLCMGSLLVVVLSACQDSDLVSPDQTSNGISGPEAINTDPEKYPENPQSDTGFLAKCAGFGSRSGHIFSRELLRELKAARKASRPYLKLENADHAGISQNALNAASLCSLPNMPGSWPDTGNCRSGFESIILLFELCVVDRGLTAGYIDIRLMFNQTEEMSL